MRNKALKIIFIVIVVLLSGFATLTQINFLDYQKPVRFKDIDQVTLNDFKGLEFFQKSLYGNKSFAYIKTSIDYEFKDDSLRIESFFHPSSSYVYNKKAYSKELLTHEIYHFKITELYTRIAKKRISDLKNVTKNQAEDLIDAIKQEEQNYQIQYDDDTFHSYVLSEQKKYEKTIDSLLNLHRNFKNPKIYLNEK
ncbi:MULTISPECIES: hypothetical protein [unclassified Flavobacterium]|uniref:hypothetical protein n=1 Tax=unclassified Flavobacterium TaxID=196869 RepID=UPI0026176CDA|nr:hypothetical protein [Flavobacterium sp.]